MSDIYLYESGVPEDTRDSSFSGGKVVEVDSDLGHITVVLGTQYKNGRGDDVTHIYITDRSSFPHCVDGPTVVLNGHHRLPKETLEEFYWSRVMHLASVRTLVEYIKSVDDAAFKAGHEDAKREIRVALGCEDE